MKSVQTPDLLGNVEEHLRKAVLAAALFGEAHEAPRIGRFALQQRIGAGAMGVVYEAFDAQLDRRVAIKLVRNENKAEAHTNRLLREARAMAKLSHPHVVTVYDVGQWEGGLFVAMELVRGGTLQGWLAAQCRHVRDTLGMFLDAGRGLVAAHDAGLIHRDFKPGNVLVGEDNRPRVADFGLVRLVGEIPSIEGQNPTIIDGFSTMTGAVLGTPAYMAPEQLQGARVDARADQFSFCVALYDALCGVFPFTGESWENRLRQIQTGNITPPAQGRRPPRRVLDVVRRGLAMDPMARFPSMKALLDALVVAERPAFGRWASITGGTLLCLGGLAATGFGKVQEPLASPAPPPVQHDSAQNHDAALVVAARLLSPTDPTLTAVLLAEVEAPEQHREWSALAHEVLAQPMARFVWNDARLSLSQHGNNAVILHDLDGNLTARSLNNGRELLRRSGGEWSAVFPRGDELLIQTPQGLEIWPLGPSTTMPSWQSERPGLARVSLGETGDIFAIAKDGSVLHWDETRPATPTLLRVIGNSIDNTRAVLSANDGVARLRTPNDEIEIWPLRSRGSPQRLHLGGKDFSELAVSHSAQQTAVGFHDGTIRIWSKGVHTPIEIRGHSSEIRHLRLNNNGERLVAWAVDGTTRIWDLKTRQSRETPLVLPRHEATSIALDKQNGDMLLTTSPDTPGIARAWNLSTREVSVLESAEDARSVGLLSPDGKWAFTSSMHNITRAWPLDSSSTTLTLGHSAPIWAGQLQGNRLATASQDGTARIWQIGKNGTLHESGVFSSAPATRVWTSILSPSGDLLATGSNDGKARIWKTNGSKPPIVLSGHEQWVYSLAFSRDGQSLFTGSKRGCIRRFRVEGGTPQVILCQADVRGQVHQIELSPDGSIGAAALASGHLVLWSNEGAVGSREPRVIPNAHGDQVQAIAFSPDGRRLVSVGRGNKVRLWDTASGALVREIGRHDGAIYHVRMSPDGRSVVTSSADETARVWPIDGDGAPVILKGHKGWVAWAEFDRNGRRVVTAGYDGTARVWDLDEPTVPRVLRGHWDAVRYATFDAQGERVMTTAMDGTVRSWDIADESVERLQRRLREATRACLTAAQRRALIGEDAATATERATACHR